MLLELPSAALHARRSETVTIEAVCFWPRSVSLVWTTSGDHSGRVVSQVAAALERGEEQLPLGASFVGRVEH